MQEPSLNRLACLEGRRDEDPELDAIAREVESTSVLDAFQGWIEELRGSADNDAPAFRKLMRLFDAGATPERVVGHHDGVAFGLRTGDEPGWLARRGNVMNLLWSAAVGTEAPWVGKSFTPLDPAELSRLTDGYERGERPTYLGINHFHRLPDSPRNQLFFSILTSLMGLRDAPPRERALYGHDRDGGLFIARRAPSVWHGTPREVLQLNYRWPGLRGRRPFSWLIDELVELDGGLYLGQLLFATRRMLRRFEPHLPPEAYHYQHFGHFVLMDDRWAAETRRVFANIGRGRVTEPAPDPRADKFTAFTLDGEEGGERDDEVMSEIRRDLGARGNIVALLHTYSRQLHGTSDNASPVFRKLDELFARGVAPREVRGHWHGALVSFHTEGYYRLSGVNTLNAAWKLGRLLSPWTGKRFEDIDPERLRALTDGREAGAVPTSWGTNTLVFRSRGEQLIEGAMRLAGIPMEDVPPEERARRGYDAESFFFIARQGASILPENRGKAVLQLNYRWPRLRTFPPDNYCIDELVQIAEGLYLGQLTYATELLLGYDPDADPADYRYRVFGYFLLMDDEWQRLRLEEGFDLHNA